MISSESGSLNLMQIPWQHLNLPNHPWPNPFKIFPARLDGIKDRSDRTIQLLPVWQNEERRGAGGWGKERKRERVSER